MAEPRALFTTISISTWQLSCHRHITFLIYIKSRLVLTESVIIGHFTFVCLVTWRLSGSEADSDLVLIQTLLLFTCKCKLVSMRTTWFTCEKQEGLYQNKVTSSLTSTQRLGPQAHNCKMAYWPIKGYTCIPPQTFVKFVYRRSLAPLSPVSLRFFTCFRQFVPFPTIWMLGIG